MNDQSYFFSVESLLDIHPLENFRLLFDNLSDQHLNKEYSTGRTPFDRKAIFRSIILKNLKGIPTLSELCYTLKDNPSAAIRCGFDIRKPLPSIQRFSDFLINTYHDDLENIRIDLAKELIQINIISGNYLSIDSCPILANVKENNLKTNVKDRFNKSRICKGDPDAKLGVIVTFAKSKKEISYFWGYRDHVVIDAQSELPIWNITKPANVFDTVMFIPMFDLIRNNLSLNIGAVLADGIYDTSTILKYVINTIKAKPRIARNIRNSASQNNLKFSKNNNPYCDAAIEMLPKGTFYDKKQDRYRRKWVCPLHHSKKYQYQYIVCPAFHPKFFDQKGCYRYIRVDEDIRTQIDYGSNSFKNDYNFRTGSERVFSRLLDICMQYPPVKGLKATCNFVTIAHITVLLVALTAAKNNFKDKVRFVKSFLPNFNPSSA
jgi:hypothetical protein